jgi:hypothetical protein
MGQGCYPHNYDVDKTDFKEKWCEECLIGSIWHKTQSIFYENRNKQSEFLNQLTEYK